MSFIKSTIKLIISFLMSALNKLNNTLDTNSLNLLRTSHNTLGRFKIFTLTNKNLLEYQDLFFQVYNFLRTNETFIIFGGNNFFIGHWTGVLKE